MNYPKCKEVFKSLMQQIEEQREIVKKEKRTSRKALNAADHIKYLQSEIDDLRRNKHIYEEVLAW